MFKEVLGRKQNTIEHHSKSRSKTKRKVFRKDSTVFRMETMHLKAAEFSCFSVICLRGQLHFLSAACFLSAEGLLSKTWSPSPHTQKGKATEKEIGFIPKMFTQKLGRH